MAAFERINSRKFDTTMTKSVSDGVVDLVPRSVLETI